ncbi:hypothetical protein [Arthrobacter luteolus]|uniref:hypothetical protein n=1 Tax=Arthrobacter luteolus TaxID=98672 RepID=UPI00384D57D3
MRARAGRHGATGQQIVRGGCSQNHAGTPVSEPDENLMFHRGELVCVIGQDQPAVQVSGRGRDHA